MMKIIVCCSPARKCALYDHLSVGHFFSSLHDCTDVFSSLYIPWCLIFQRISLSTGLRSYCALLPIHCISPQTQSYQDCKAYCRNDSPVAMLRHQQLQEGLFWSSTTQMHTISSTEWNSNGKEITVDLCKHNGNILKNTIWTVKWVKTAFFFSFGALMFKRLLTRIKDLSPA